MTENPKCDDSLRDALERMDDPAGAFEVFVMFMQLPPDKQAFVLGEMRTVAEHYGDEDDH